MRRVAADAHMKAICQLLEWAWRVAFFVGNLITWLSGKGDGYEPVFTQPPAIIFLLR